MNKEYPNSGALFVNNVKKSPKAPDYSGELSIDLASHGVGVGTLKLRLAGWKKSSQNGTEFLSISASPPRENEGQRQQAPLIQDDPF